MTHSNRAGNEEYSLIEEITVRVRQYI